MTKTGSRCVDNGTPLPLTFINKIMVYSSMNERRKEDGRREGVVARDAARARARLLLSLYQRTAGRTAKAARRQQLSLFRRRQAWHIMNGIMGSHSIHILYLSFYLSIHMFNRQYLISGVSGQSTDAHGISIACRRDRAHIVMAAWHGIGVMSCSVL